MCSTGNKGISNKCREVVSGDGAAQLSVPGRPFNSDNGRTRVDLNLQ